MHAKNITAALPSCHCQRLRIYFEATVAWQSCLTINSDKERLFMVSEPQKVGERCRLIDRRVARREIFFSVDAAKDKNRFV